MNKGFHQQGTTDNIAGQAVDGLAMMVAPQMFTMKGMMPGIPKTDGGITGELTGQV